MRLPMRSMKKINKNNEEQIETKINLLQDKTRNYHSNEVQNIDKINQERFN